MKEEPRLSLADSELRVQKYVFKNSEMLEICRAQYQRGRDMKKAQANWIGAFLDLLLNTKLRT